MPIARPEAETRTEDETLPGPACGTEHETMSIAAIMMMATLLLPAGVTSQASILYKDEDRLLSAAENADETYVQQVLPGKMEYNLQSLMEFSFWGELKTMLDTVLAVLH